MNRIPVPVYDDASALRKLCENTLLDSFPKLASDLKKITKGYAQYLNANGNAYLIKKVKLSGGNASFLIKHYNSPPVAISYIKTLRDKNSHRTCPMCGSFHRISLDHILPKEQFAEFAIFSANLVPAYKCNFLRKEVLFGAKADERVLHPYFDAALAKRLLFAKFEDLGPVPKISIELMIAKSNADFAAVHFHLRSIVLPTALMGYISEQWSDFVRQPSLIVRALEKNPTTLDGLREVLIKEREKLDDKHRSKNNWNSIFINGLLRKNVLNWIFDQMWVKGRKADGPLV